MDIGKLLLIYMSLSLANTIGTSEVPDVSPAVEDSVQSIVVSENAGEVQTSPVEDAASSLFPQELPLPEGGNNVEISTATAKPSVPINKGYKIVRFKDKGSNVRKLQQRLIELGYLDEGADDGVFGNKTLEAVKDFQKANGISRDGVAGDTTQTYLYDYEGVVAKKTPTPSATEAPAPSEIEIIPELESAEKKDSFIPVANGKILIMGEQAPLTVLTYSDGVMQSSFPQVWKDSAGNVVVSLNDMALAIEGWSLGLSGDSVLLKAGNMDVAIDFAQQGCKCSVNGSQVELAEGDAVQREKLTMVSEDFLEKTVADMCIWDEDESTLIVTLKAE